MASHDDIRRIALALPGVEEAPHHHLTSFRVKGKIFATLGEDRPLMLKFDPEDQRNLVEAYPGAIEPVPGGWGRQGSTFVRHEAFSEADLAPLVRTAWARIAPKALLG